MSPTLTVVAGVAFSTLALVVSLPGLHITRARAIVETGSSSTRVLVWIRQQHCTHSSQQFSQVSY